MRDAQRDVDLTDGPWPASVIHALPVGLLEVDAWGRAVRVNAELARLLAVASGGAATSHASTPASRSGEAGLPVTERWPQLAEVTAAVLSGRGVDGLLTMESAVLRVRGVPRCAGPGPSGGLIVVSDAASDRRIVVDLREEAVAGSGVACTPSGGSAWTSAPTSVSLPAPARPGSGRRRGQPDDGRRALPTGRGEEHAATHDPLTGLPNGVLLMQCLADALTSCPPGRRVAVMALDVGGSSAGDLPRNDAPTDDVPMVRLAAARLSHLVGPQDVVARLEGGRFAVVLQGVRAGADTDGFLARTAERLAGIMPDPPPGAPLSAASGPVPVKGLGMVLADPASGHPRYTDAGQLAALAWEAVERSRGAGKPVVWTETAAEAERARLAALRAYDVYDSALDDVLQGITQVTACACDAHAALVTFVDSDLQWVRAASGVDAAGLLEAHGPRHLALCDRTIRGRDVLVVPDTEQDAAFRASRHVGWQQGMRFYAGAPLITPEGRAVGTLCVFDTQPRGLSGRQRRSLTVLAAETVGLLEAHRAR